MAIVVPALMVRILTVRMKDPVPQELLKAVVTVELRAAEQTASGDLVLERAPVHQVTLKAVVTVELRAALLLVLGDLVMIKKALVRPVVLTMNAALATA